MDIRDLLLHQIKNNALNGKDYDTVVAGLIVLNNKPYAEIKGYIDELLDLQELQQNEAGELVLVNLDKLTTKPKFENKPSRQGKQQGRAKGTKSKMGKLIEGKIQGTRGNFAFFIPFDEVKYEDVYIHEKNLNGALNGDTVSIEAFKNARGYEGRVVQIVERANTKVVGKIQINKTNAFVVSDDVKLGKDIFVPKSKILNAQNGDKVVVQINKFFADKNPEGQVVEVLGKPNEIETEVLSIIRSYNLYEQFPNKVLAAADHVPTEVKPEEHAHRLDLTKELLFTIDGADARDLDDAVSLKLNEDGTRTLGVHIADVGEYVKLHSVLDDEAFKRATSVYFPNLVLPMLPKKLSNGICSLNEMVERLTLSVFITYDQKAAVKDYSIHESIIKSKKRFTYKEVQDVLDGDEEALSKNHSFSETLIEMNKLAKQLNQMREKRGAIDFDIPEVKIELNETGDVSMVQKRERNDSHRLIEAFMIAANEAVAEHFNKLKMPFVYRIHEKPDEEKMNNFANFVKQFGIKPEFYAANVAPKDLQKILGQLEDDDVKYVVNRICLRSLKKAKYYPDCLGHFGLASTYYCHFTSPIRRYPDLTIHRIIKDFLHKKLSGKVFNETKHFVGASSQVSSEREVLAEKAERDVDDLYKVFYMTHHLNETFEGRISSVTAFGVYVELENTVEGLLRLEDLPADEYTYSEEEYSLTGYNHKFAIGQTLKVQAVRADILAREVDFMLE